MKAFANRVVRIDLAKESIGIEELNPQWARDFIGGRGYGEKILVEEIDPNIDPLSPDNKLIFTVGPLAATGAPAGNRIMLVTKGSLNGAIACSNAGGFFGREMKQAGYDALIIEGRADRPVYLSILDDEIKVNDASSLWGLSTWETDERFKERYPKARTITIGSGGEKLSRISAVMIDRYRAAGRTGVGAVMGSKNLKGMVVMGTGQKRPELADPKGFKVARKKALEKLKEHPVASQGLPSYGTAVLVNIINKIGSLPVNNAQDAYFKKADKISGEYMAEHTLIKKIPCAGCPIACGRVTHITDGPYAGSEGEGPEYETIWAFGAMCGVSDLNAITKAHYLCDYYGLDGISVGSTIACAMELYEKGYLPKKEVPFELRFGNGEAMVEAVKLLGERKGFGDILAEGSYRLASKYGHPELSMSVKKQEFPAYDPRGVKGIGLEYATSNRGACHVRGYTISPEVLGVPKLVDRLTYEGKPALVKLFQDFTAVVDSSGLCLFTTFGMELSDYTALLKAATGFDYRDETLLRAGERIWNLERIFNLKAGFTSADDTLPERLLKEPIKSGPSKGEVSDLSKMLPEYYRLRGWNRNGIPSEEKKRELSL